MPMGDVIRRKRKELGLTQEQVAQRLGISAPAVNKWERGSSYPDITILPALARLLNTDANTLLCFQEELSDEEIAGICNEIAKIMDDQGAEAASAMKKRPGREALALSIYIYIIFSGTVPCAYHVRIIYAPCPSAKKLREETYAVPSRSMITIWFLSILPLWHRPLHPHQPYRPFPELPLQHCPL